MAGFHRIGELLRELDEVVQLLPPELQKMLAHCAYQPSKRLPKGL